MRVEKILLAGCVLLAVGCSSSQKKDVAEKTTPVATAQSQKDKTAATAANSNSSKDEMTCKRGDETRILAIEGVQPKGCKLFYSRYGTNSSIASSIHGNAYCEKVRSAVSIKLKDAGFECLTVKSTATTASAANTTPAPTAPAAASAKAVPTATTTVTPAATDAKAATSAEKKK